MEKSVIAYERHKNRVDLLIEDNLGEDLAVEMLFNEINNTSPLDFTAAIVTGKQIGRAHV